jgi:hypothetical protein
MEKAKPTDGLAYEIFSTHTAGHSRMKVLTLAAAAVLLQLQQPAGFAILSL